MGFENNDDEDEDEEDENLEQLLTPSKESDGLSQFSRWLVIPDGKSKNAHQAKQSKVILKGSSQHSFKLEFLFKRHKKLRNRWLLTVEQKEFPGQLSYLHSLRFFYKFILRDEPEECAFFILKCNSKIIAIENWL